MAFLRKGFLKSAHRRNELHCQIDPSPVAAIFVFFLALFIVDQPITYHSHYVQRVVARHTRYMPGVLREDAITITVRRDGTINFRNVRMTPNYLASEIRDAVRDGAEKKIYLEVDARARYSDVSAVLSQIQMSGIENVSLIADSPRSVAMSASLPTR